MFGFKILFINVFVICTFQCVSANSLDVIQDGLQIAWLFSEVATGKHNPIIVEAEEVFVDNILTSGSNETGVEKESSAGSDCAGLPSTLLGLIQCAIRTKIESFSLELSKAAIPDQLPEGFKPHVIDSKVEGGLEEWFQKNKKYLDSLNC